MSYYDFFAQASSTSVGDWIKWRTRQRQLAVMQPYLPNSNCAILEIGPGMGELTELILLAGYRNCTTVEPNAVMRERLERKGIATKDYQIPYLNEKDGDYDVIVLSHVFEHLHDTREARIFIAEARRVLRPSGLLCIISPDYLHAKRDFFNCDYTHSNVTSVRRTRQLFHDGGFRTLKYTYFSGFFAGISATLVSHLFRLGLFFTDGNGRDEKLYKLKMTFTRQFLIIGQKQSYSSTPHDEHNKTTGMNIA